MAFRYFASFFLISSLFAACGVKTDPVPYVEIKKRSTSSTPPAPSDEVRKK